jgi:hypothetical protein
MTTLTNQRRVNKLSSLAIVIVLASAGAIVAQPGSDPAESPIFRPVSPNPVEMGFSQHHSSTVIEGAQRGRAAVIQAYGNYQLDVSQAAVLRQQARALNRQNNLKQTEALYAQEAMWDDARIQAHEQREARLAEGQKILADRRATVYRQAYQLSPSEFDPKTGAIVWPLALQDERYQQVREHVEELFRVQRSYGDPQPGTANELARNIETLRRTLRSDMNNLGKEDYLAASKFLVGLKLEAESPSAA